jgi:hypothetical protein
MWLVFTTNDSSWWAEPYWICSEVEIDTALVSGVHLTYCPACSEPALGIRLILTGNRSVPAHQHYVL